MDAWAYLRFTAISILIGLAAFCISYAAWVWRRRQGARPLSGSPLDRSIRGCSIAAVVCGVAAAVAVCGVREIIPQNGLISLNDAMAVRSRRDHHLDFLSENGTVRAGDVIARFRSAAQESQAAALQARLERLKAQKTSIELKPLEIDAELARKHQSLQNRVNQLEGVIPTLMPELTTTVRTGLESRLQRVDKVTALNADLVKQELLLRQAEAELSFSRQELERTESLKSRGVVSASDMEKARQDVEVCEAEVVKLKRGLAQVQQEQEQLRQGAKTLDDLIAEQSASLGREIEKLKEDLSRSRLELAKVSEEIESDTLRARQLRQAEQCELYQAMVEVEAELDGARKSSGVVSPFDGFIIYRNAAPNSIEEHGVMMVLSRGAGARVQFVVPSSGVEAAKQAQIEVWTKDSAFASSLRATVVKTEPSPYEPGRVLVEAVCEPPPDLIFTLANRQSLPVMVSWRPPLWSIPTFQMAGCLLLAGGGGWYFSQRRIIRDAAKASQAATPAAAAAPVTPPVAVPAPAFLRGESQRTALTHGSAGTMLEMLGSQLREAILDGEITSELVASAEWALDRHHGRAVRLLRTGLLAGADLAVERERLMAALEAAKTVSPIEAANLQRVVEAVCGMDEEQRSAIPQTARTGRGVAR